MPNATEELHYSPNQGHDVTRRTLNLNFWAQGGNRTGGIAEIGVPSL